MKIIMIHPHDVLTSPWTIRMIKLAEKMIGYGHQVEVFSFVEQQRRDLGFQTHCPESLPITINSLQKLQYLHNTNLLYRLCKACDILHIQKCFIHSVLPALLAAYATNTPIHYDWDDWEEGITQDYLGHHIFTWIIKFYERRLPHLIDSLSVASDALRERAITLGFPVEKIVKISVGADIVEFSTDIPADRTMELPPGDGPLVLYAGQIEGANYAPLFVEAATIVRHAVPDARFLIVGGGFRLEELIELNRTKGLENCLYFTDYVAHRTIPHILAHADVCVATFEDNQITRAKSPLKIVEYMAMGKPIVASAVGEVNVMLQNCGVLVPPGDAPSIANAVISLLHNPEQRNQLGQQARQKAETIYNWDIIATKLLGAYQKCLERWHK